MPDSSFLGTILSTYLRLGLLFLVFPVRVDSFAGAWNPVCRRLRAIVFRRADLFDGAGAGINPPAIRLDNNRH